MERDLQGAVELVRRLLCLRSLCSATGITRSISTDPPTIGAAPGITGAALVAATDATTIASAVTVATLAITAAINVLLIFAALPVALLYTTTFCNSVSKTVSHT